jgi:TolB-like protein
MRGFFAELKRRQVYRIAVYYAAAAWLLVQIADIVVENFNLADRFMQLFIVCAVLGFPIALVLAWIYESSPSGIRRTAALDKAKEEEIASEVGAVVAATKTDERPGIVVLPFDRFSDEPMDEVICNGFTEDLTSLLANIPDVFVISRNTAFSYQGQRKDMREIGRELGVRYLLEGSLRRVDNHMRVTAQLIDTETGSHLWADKYDTPTDELLKVQDALVSGIALRLGTEIARAEFQLTQRQQPSDMNAWSLYQSAKGTLMFKGWSKDSVKQAIDQLHQAIELDPGYAAPQAYLSLLLALAHWIKLVDDLPAAHDESVAAANRALELEPNSSEVLGYAGCAFSDLGYKQRGIPILEKAIDLDASNAQAKGVFVRYTLLSDIGRAGLGTRCTWAARGGTGPTKRGCEVKPRAGRRLCCRFPWGRHSQADGAGRAYFWRQPAGRTCSINFRSRCSVLRVRDFRQQIMPSPTYPGGQTETAGRQRQRPRQRRG